jgi:MarR family transcriptional regulator, 2-MHQ and catechol-resistance regulon repressor
MSYLDSTSEEAIQQTIDLFWETFPPVWNRITGNVRAIAMEKFGISVEQFHILRHIRKGTGSVSELAVVKQISRPAISQAVDVLVDKGLIVRRQSKKDRRFVELDLTQSGNELLNAIFKNNRDWMKGKLCLLTPQEISTIFQSMEILKKSFVDQLT